VKRAADYAILVLAMLAAWQVLHWIVGQFALTSPVETLQFLGGLLQRHSFWGAAQATLVALSYATAIAIVGGLAIGLPLGFSRTAGDIADPFLISLFSIPKITLYPVILLIFGLGLPAKVAFGAIHGIFPIALFALSGIRNVKPVYVKTGRVLGLSAAETIFSVLLPAALPEIVTGIRVGFASTILGTIIGEMFAGEEGLGVVLVKAIDHNDVALIMALTLLLFVLSSAANGVLLALDHRLHRRVTTA